MEGANKSRRQANQDFKMSPHNVPLVKYPRYFCAVSWCILSPAASVHPERAQQSNVVLWWYKSLKRRLRRLQPQHAKQRAAFTPVFTLFKYSQCSSFDTRRSNEITAHHTQSSWPSGLSVHLWLLSMLQVYSLFKWVGPAVIVGVKNCCFFCIPVWLFCYLHLWR